MTVQIAYGHIAVAYYFAIAITLIIQVYPIRMRRGGTTPIRDLVVFGLTWPLHLVPGTFWVMRVRMRTWRIQKRMAKFQKRGAQRQRKHLVRRLP